MPGPRNIEFAFAFEGRNYTGVVDEEVIATFEDETDRSIFELAERNGRAPKLSLMGSFLAATLSRHHKVDRLLAMRMLRDPKISSAMMGGVGQSMPQDGDVDGEGEVGQTAENPPPASGESSAGKTD